jgi:hypothetical protein
MAHWMPALQKAIWDRFRADNGAGGLWASGSELIGGVYMTNAPENASGSHIVVAVVGTGREDAFRTRQVLVEVDFHTKVPRPSSLGQDPSTADDGLVAGAIIMERIDGDWDRQPAGTPPTYGFDRYRLTLAGTTPWTADIMEFQEARDETDAAWFHWVQTFRVYVSRTAV